MIKQIFFLFFIPINLYALSFDDFDWKVLKKKNNIVVYKGTKSQDTGLIPIRAIAPIHAPLEKIVSVMSDHTRKHEWVPKILKNIIVEESDALNRIEYSQYRAPWPLMGRDFLIRMTADFDKSKDQLKITIRSIKDKRHPPLPDFVRGETYLGELIMTRKKPNLTEFEVRLITDFKGSIPKWIINLVQRKWPFRMITRLRKQLNKPDVVTLEAYKYLK